MESSYASTMVLPQKIDINYKDKVCEVFELARKHGMEARLWMVEKDGPIHKAIFTYRLTAGDFSAEAKGPTASEAKHLCAEQVLPELRCLPLPADEKKKKKKRAGVCWRELPTFKDNDNPISCLDMIVVNMKGIPPKYTIMDVDKQLNPWIFYVQVTVADVTAVGLGLDKKDAKRNAASKVLNSFGYNFVVKEPEPRTTEDITSQQIETDVLEEVPKDDEPQQDQECSVAQDDSIQTEVIQSQTEDESAAAQDKGAEVFLDDIDEVQTLPEEFVYVESPEDTATDSVERAALLRDQEQLPVLTQTVSEEVLICDVPREASTTQETATDVYEEVEDSQKDQECSVAEDFFQTEEIQSPTDDTSVDTSTAAATQDKAAEVFLDDIEEVQKPQEEFVYVESPEDTSTDGVKPAALLRDQEQSPVLTQTVSEEVTVCDVPHDASTTQETETDVHEEVDESQQDQECAVAENFFQTEEIQSPTDNTSVLFSAAAAQDKAAEVFLDDIKEEVQTPHEEIVYLETCKNTAIDGVEQAELLRDQEQSPVLTHTVSEEVTVSHETETDVQEEVEELQQDQECAIAEDFFQTEEIQSPRDDASDTSADGVALLSDQEQSPEVALTENKEETLHKVLDQSEDDQTTDKNGPTSLLEDLTIPRAQETVVNDRVSATSQPDIITEDFVESSDTSTKPCRISPTFIRHSYFITNALTEKLFKLAGSKDQCKASLMGVRLHHSIKQQLELDENSQIKLNNSEKIGKAATKRLMAEYGSAEAVLSAAGKEDTTAFEAAAAKHINTELRAFQKRPKSALSRLFSRMKKAFTF